MADHTTKESAKTVEESHEPNGESPVNKFAIMRTGLTLYGSPVLRYPIKKDPIEHIKSIRGMDIRDDDVIVVAYPKSGTHWMWEVVHMLITGKAEYEKRTKEHMMLEFMETSKMDNEPSPRIINSHLPFCHLPQQIDQKKTKIVHVYRNPKDNLTSMYHHLKQIIPQESNFEEFLQSYTDSSLRPAQSQFEFLRQFQDFEKAHPDHPIKHVCFEEMKRDPVRLTKEIADFLQVPVSEKFCEDVAAACSFDQMKTNVAAKEFPKEPLQVMDQRNLNGLASVYRKGTIGDWKNQFTVAQHEIIEQHIAENSNGINFKFIYE